MKKSKSSKIDKSVKLVIAELDKNVNVSREACNRQAVCKEVKKTNIEKRLDDCRISKRINDINNFSVSSQAQLIDLVLRSNTAISESQIALAVMSHKDCNTVFKKVVDYVTVLKRVKRHSMIYANIQARVIKRNSYQL